jgi:hypothetical protein
VTAYTGLLEIGKPAAGETVVVAAASGAVGSVVGQVARIKGARAVRIAGGPDKCSYVRYSASIPASITVHLISLPVLPRLARKVLTFISRMSAERYSRPYSRYSIRSPAFRCAG